MKHIITLLLLAPCVNKSMDRDDHRQAHRALGSLVTQSDRPIEDLLEEIGLLSPSDECAKKSSSHKKHNHEFLRPS